MVAADEDALIAPRGNELVHWIVELQRPCSQSIISPRSRSAWSSNRFGNRVGVTGRLRFDSKMSLRLEVGDLSLTRDQRDVRRACPLDVAVGDDR